MELFYGFFNIFLGICFVLIGVKRIKLKTEISKPWSLFFKISGIGLVLGGMITLIQNYS